MNTPDEVLKAQRSLSYYSGSKKIALWLSVGGLAMGAVDVGDALLRNESALRGLSASAMLVLMALLVRATCTQQIRTLQAVLQRNRTE